MFRDNLTRNKAIILLWCITICLRKMYAIVRTTHFLYNFYQRLLYLLFYVKLIMDGLRCISNCKNMQIIVMEKLIYNSHQMAACVLNPMTRVTKPWCKKCLISIKKMGDRRQEYNCVRNRWLSAGAMWNTSALFNQSDCYGQISAPSKNQ